MGGVVLASLPPSDDNLLIVGDSLMTNTTYQGKTCTLWLMADITINKVVL